MEENNINRQYEFILNYLKENQESCWLDVQGVIIKISESPSDQEKDDFLTWVKQFDPEKSIIDILDINKPGCLTLEDIPTYFLEPGWDYQAYEQYADRWMKNNK